MAISNVTAIYDLAQQQVVNIIVDAIDLTDPAWNPEGCIQVPIDTHQYSEGMSHTEIEEIALSVTKRLANAS